MLVSLCDREFGGCMVVMAVFFEAVDGAMEAGEECTLLLPGCFRFFETDELLVAFGLAKNDEVPGMELSFVLFPLTAACVLRVLTPVARSLSVAGDAFTLF
jgi:hypothetical protein